MASHDQFPRTFVAKYLGRRDARGLWGIKHTRQPVDDMVAEARALKPGATLPFLKLQVSPEGVTVSEMPQNTNPNFEAGLFPIDSISYGVQDLVYTRVFAMIYVRDSTNVFENHPFECHAFVCDSRQNARALTLALASAFQEFSKTVKQQGCDRKPRKFAIDLRSAEEIQADLDGSPADHSEA
ncbi:low density lipoprotein receptor adapter protein 1-like [Tachypleus tridentatus]|uniref:low density lipoprotein receptor adapter protein 1-like n=1 Tax=Tachypleus tridentatus TaxID=6853 RepID=UPI003FD3B361